MIVFILIGETSIDGVFSSKEAAYQRYAKENEMTVTEAEAEFLKPSGGYPALEEVEVNGKWNMDR